MAASARRLGATGTARWGDAAQAMYRAAQAVSHPGGPSLFSDLVRELAGVMRSATAFVAVFADESRSELRTLAFQLDDEPRENSVYQLEGTPCSHVVGRAFRHVRQGVAAEFPSGAIFAAAGMDSYAAYPLNDSAGTPLGLLVAMDRKSIADAALAEALLKIFAGRIVAEIERSRSDEALRVAALAVSGGYGESVFAELVRYLATLLHVEAAFIACHDVAALPDMRMMAMVCDGQSVAQGHYALDASPCARVLGQGFVAIPTGLRTLFPDEHNAQVMGMDSYAGFPLFDRQGHALGTVGVASRRPLVNPERIESMLQIFAVRAGAELEQLRALEALRQSEASYRAIFESAEDAILIHEWDSGEVIDANPKACETFGYDREELRRMPVGELSSGVAPFTPAQARAPSARWRPGQTLLRLQSRRSSPPSPFAAGIDRFFDLSELRQLHVVQESGFRRVPADRPMAAARQGQFLAVQRRLR